MAANPTTDPFAITEEECFKHFWSFVHHEKPSLMHFYNNSALAEKAVRGASTVSELLAEGCPKEIAMNLALLTLYDIVMLLDDSFHMISQEYVFHSLKQMVEGAASIYNLANEDGLLAVRFMNGDQGKRNVTKLKAATILDKHPFTRTYNYLDICIRDKVVDEFLTSTLRKPLRVVIINGKELEGSDINWLSGILGDGQILLHDLEDLAYHFACIGNDASSPNLTGFPNTEHVRVYNVEHTLSERSYKWTMLPKILLGDIVNYRRDTCQSEIDYYKLKARLPAGSRSVIHTTQKTSAPTTDGRLEVETTWEDVEALGEGAFGSVMLQRSGSQFRAVKRLTRARTKYARELEALAKVTKHEELFVQLLGWFQDKAEIYIVMEYIKHGDLAKMDHGLRRANVKRITKQVLEGLDILHKQGICHRDIKPQNILLASLDPVMVKIADFGASKYLRPTQDHTRIGTPGYLAPELQGLVPDISTRGYTIAVDLWSLGCVVYEILTSSRPFTQPTMASSGMMSDEDTETELGPQLDIRQLCDFCCGRIEFPKHGLEQAAATEHEITFVIGLMVANPVVRLTASQALATEWLLKTEVSDSNGPCDAVNLKKWKEQLSVMER